MKPSRAGSALKLGALLFPALLIGSSGQALAQAGTCGALPDHTELTNALQAAVAEENAGLGNDMWATIVDRDGIVCAVTFSGADRRVQWPGSRVISAQKANTANAFSLPARARGASGLALSTANLWDISQPGGSALVGDPGDAIPGGSLFGLQFSNPVDPAVAYQGPPAQFGQSNDPMVGNTPGGVNVFGGGLALYDENGRLLGGLGVSGDTSCTDHIVAWKVRDRLGLDFVPLGVSDTGDDNIIHDLVLNGAGHTVSESGFGHPECDPDATAIAEALPDTHPIGTAVEPPVEPPVEP